MIVLLLFSKTLIRCKVCIHSCCLLPKFTLLFHRIYLISLFVPFHFWCASDVLFNRYTWIRPVFCVLVAQHARRMGSFLKIFLNVMSRTSCCWLFAFMLVPITIETTRVNSKNVWFSLSSRVPESSSTFRACYSRLCSALINSIFNNHFIVCLQTMLLFYSFVLFHALSFTLCYQHGSCFCALEQLINLALCKHCRWFPVQRRIFAVVRSIRLVESAPLITPRQ